MKSSRFSLFAYSIIFLISLSLRVSLALVNREADDNHMFPVRNIMLTNSLPTKAAGGESFQPKLYHYTVARLAKLEGINPWNKNGLMLMGQLINFIAGLIIVLVAFMLIKYFPVGNEKLKLLTFGLVALSPSLIRINSQASNDTFVILLS